MRNASHGKWKSKQLIQSYCGALRQFETEFEQKYYF
jgi:hypothetical protein